MKKSLMKAIFMGTPDFAVPILRALTEYCEVQAVVTRPDAPKGRGHNLRYSPVKEAADGYGIPLLQPNRAGDDEFTEKLGEYGADVFVVAAFGLLLPEYVLRLPVKYGCINVHASLLPKLRGAAPIQWAIMNGEKKTGVTIMHMDKKLDAGDMILKEEIEIEPDDTGGLLHDKLSVLGAGLLINALELIEAGKAKRVPQDHNTATYAPMLTKAHGHIDWRKTPDDIENLVRGLAPRPTAYAYYNGQPLKIWRVRKIPSASSAYVPGELAGFTADGFLVAANGGFVEVLEVQAQGSRRMTAMDYLRGHIMESGEKLE